MVIVVVKVVVMMVITVVMMAMAVAMMAITVVMMAMAVVLVVSTQHAGCGVMRWPSFILCTACRHLHCRL